MGQGASILTALPLASHGPDQLWPTLSVGAAGRQDESLWVWKGAGMSWAARIAAAAGAVFAAHGARAEAVAPAPPADAAAIGSDATTRHDQLRLERREERERDWYLTGFLLKESEARLPLFPYKILTATLPFRPAYAATVAVDRVVVPRFAIPLPGFTLRGNSLDLEAQFLKHFGREHSAEVSAAAVLRSGQFGVIGRTSANVAWGNGFSYAIDAPNYELGRNGVRGVDTIHLQYHMAFKAEVTSGAAPHLHYVLRLHHRSGIYGLISPSRTGSNYLGLGLRFDLRR